MRRTVLAWTALALAGLAVAVGVTYAATQLVGQRIGLAAEPRVEGARLVAPPAASAPATPTRDSPRTPPSRTTRAMDDHTDERASDDEHGDDHASDEDDESDDDD